MRKINHTLFQGSLAALCLNASVLLAGDVIMFDRPPSAEEMGNILFSNRIPQPVGKTRSIAFGKAEMPFDKPLEQLEEDRDSVGLPIEFSFNSTEILDQSRPFLDEIGEMLILEKFSKENLVVEGHTDASGPERYNYHLSERRAIAVKNYLQKNHHISADRLSVAAQGETSPLPGRNPYARVNRRVQFHRGP
jgi:outer membrane protein OmpA-like peptidoglycan-associated protein